MSLVTLPDQAYVTIIKYLEMRDIVQKMLLLNKKLRELFISENYILFKRFLRDFSLLNERLKRAEIPGKVPILQLLRDNYSLSRREGGGQPSQNLFPFAFYTDGGTYNDDAKYFINNIFSQSGVCHSTKVPKNANVQFYVGRRVEPEPNKALPKDHKVKG